PAPTTPPHFASHTTATIPQDNGGNLASEHVRPRGRPDSTVRLQAMLLLPAHDSGLSVRAIAAINTSADPLLDLPNRRPLLRPLPRMNRVALVFRVIEVPLDPEEHTSELQSRFDLVC